MYQHVLLIYSDYKLGERIALHECYQNVEDVVQFMNICKTIRAKFSELNFSFQHIQTEECSENSISMYDGYFNGIQYCKSIEEFIELVTDDLKVRPIDIANFILCKKRYTHLELQKILYFVYCKYLAKTSKTLFDEDFEAWKYGPVVPSVYSKFKEYERKELEKECCEKPIISSKFMKFNQYPEIVDSINETLNDFENCTVTGLVNESHKKGAPWDIVYKKGKGIGGVISKEIIRKHVMQV